MARVDSGRIDDSRDWGWLADHELLLLDDANLREALARFSPDGMRAALARSRELLAVPSPEVTAMVRDDPLGFHESAAAADWRPRSQGSRSVVSQDGYVTADGRRRLVIARPAQPPYDTAFSHALFDRLETIARERRTGAATKAAKRPPLVVEFAGGHRIALEAEAVVKRESIVNGAGSLALILPLLLLVFRSVRLVAIGALPSALSFLIVLGVLGFAGATLSAAAAGASAMLFGLGVDGVVLLYVTHRLALEQTGNAAAAIRGMAAPAASMVLGMWTTAATFLGLLVVDFPSLEQLGLLIGASMFVCGIATLVLVPASLPARPPLALRSLNRCRDLRARARRTPAGARRGGARDDGPWVRRDEAARQPHARSTALGHRRCALSRRGHRRVRSALGRDRGAAARPLSNACSTTIAGSSRRSGGECRVVPLQSAGGAVAALGGQQPRGAGAPGIAIGREYRARPRAGGGRQPGFVPGRSLRSAPACRTRRGGAADPRRLRGAWSRGHHRPVPGQDRGSWMLATYAFPSDPAEVAALGATVAARSEAWW